MAGVTLSGLSSGLDTDGIIQGLMQVEAAPRQQLVLKQSAAQARHDGLKQVLDKLNALKLASDDLSSVLTWNPVQTVTPSDSTKATARMISGAGPGSYAVNVTQLATAEQRTYNYTPPAADETYTLNGKSIAVTASESVDAIAAAINADATYGVYAVNAGGRLVMASRTTGAASTITLTGGAGALSEDASARKIGKDAAYSIDGTNYTSSSNTISSASGATGFVFGVELNLTGTGSFNVSVSPPSVDKTAVTNSVKAFVDAYNSAVDFMRSKVNEKRIPNAKTTSDAQTGALWSDDSVDQAMEDLRSTLATYTQGGSNPLFDQLNEIGISTGNPSGGASFSQDSVNGKLVLDTTKLGAALDSDPAAVQRVLGGELGTGGFSQSFSSVLKNYVETGGVFSSRIDAANTDVKDFTDSIADMDTRLSQKQDQLRQMFTSMELALQKAKSQGAELLAKLGVSSNS